MTQLYHSWVCTQNNEPKIYTPKYQTDICTPMFIAALVIIYNRRKRLKFPPTDEWINKMRFMCGMEYYSAMRGINCDPC